MKFKTMLKGAVVGLAFAATLGAQNATASTVFSFVRAAWPGNGAGGPDLGQQFKMFVTETALGVVEFKFVNQVGTPSSISDIYFNNALLALVGGLNVTGISGAIMNPPANPVPFNSWGAYGNWCHPLNTPGCVSVGSDNTTPGGQYTNGLDSRSDFITFGGVLSGTTTFQQLINSLQSDNGARVGLGALHGTSLLGTGDYQYVNVVPLPAAAWLFGSALLGFVGWSKRRKV